MNTSKTTGYTRNKFGALSWSGENTPINLINGIKLLKKAIALDNLPSEYIDTNKKGFGDCLNYDIYDVIRGAVLVQQRNTTIDKYGLHPQKDYYIISDSGKKVNLVNRKNMIVKWSRRAKKVGDIIKADRGHLKINTGTLPEIGYKAVCKNEHGNYVSVWDKSPWPLNKTRIETATKDHTGGFYYYPNLSSLKSAIEENDVFGEAREHNNLFILKVRVEGARHEIFNSKHCASKITPLHAIK